MNMLDWARKEVEIACRKENPREPEGDEEGKWIEISKEEYDERKSRKL